jgi:uncharacterized membrane protein YdjX (TVP38/TMEM64 family)
MKRDASKLKFYIFVALIVIVILISILLHVKGYHFSLYKSLDKMSSMRFFPLVYILLYFVSSFFPLPFLAFFGAAIFPFYEAFLLSMVGNILFFITMFYLTRWLGRDYVERYEKTHPNIRKFDKNFHKHAFFYIFFLRLSMIFPPEAINIISGLSKVKFKEYILSSIFGTIPVMIVSIFLIESYKLKDFYMFFITLIIFLLLIVLPFLLIKKLRNYLKKL